MTPEELEVFRLRVRIMACEFVLKSFYNSAVGNSLAARQPFHDRFLEFQKMHSTVSLKGYPAELSDLASAEYQEALDDLLTKLQNGTL